MYINRFVRIIKYWLKLQPTDNILLQYVYTQAVKDCNNGYVNWVYNVKKMLIEYDFEDVFENVHAINTKSFPLVFKLRVIKMYKQEWWNSVNKSTVMDVYKFFKSSLDYELYLDILPKSLRVYFSRLRLSVHPLRIQTGRYANDNRPRNERYCIYCSSNDIEDEYHFVCICPCYSVLRSKYINKCYYVKPSVYKYLQLLKSTNKIELIKLSLYFKHALQMRADAIYILNAEPCVFISAVNN